MPKNKLKILLLFFNGLMSIKRVSLFLLRFLFKGILEEVGSLLARFLVFPFYKLYLKSHFKDLKIYQLIFNQSVFFVLFVVTGLFLSGSETKLFGTNKYISGTQSLLFQSLSAGSATDYIEEEGNGILVPETVGVDFLTGLTAPEIIDEELFGHTSELVVFDDPTLSVMAPIILPGVEFGVVSTKRETIKYVVQRGDTLASIANYFGINVETLGIENKITTRTILQPGDVLNVLPVKGISHKIVRGNTLQKIANTYKANVAKIIEFNGITGDKDLKVGETIIIPDGIKPAAPKAVVVKKPAAVPSQTTTVRPAAAQSSGHGMVWPTTKHTITQYYSWKHGGIDIGIKTGSAIYAADDGVVEKSGWNTGGYGYMVLINHGNGIKTRYGHNSKLYAVAGEEVRKGDVVALSGSTGRSTGPHLHFEVIVNGTRVNPFLYVR